MNESGKTPLSTLLTQAEANCRHLRTANISTLFEEYWNRFSNLDQTELQNVEVRIIKQYLTNSQTEYKKALLDTLGAKCELAKLVSEAEELEALRKYKLLTEILATDWI